jgi:hypothetical protein
MTLLRERTTTRPLPDEAVIEARPRGTALRILGAAAVLVVGAVHLEQYFGVHFDVVPIIGPLFVLNFAGAAAIALGLLVFPFRWMRALLALGGIGIAATSFVFFFISLSRPLFGFEDYGYRPATIVALAAEVATVVLLGGYLGALWRSRRT